MRLTCACVLLLVLAIGSGARAQTTFLGIGPTYSIPMGTFDTTNTGSFGGTVVLGSRKYCHLWTGLRLSYTAFRKKTDSTELYYSSGVFLSPEARWFPALPTDFPFYVQGMLTLGGIGGTDSASHAGLGVGGGIGYLLFYDSNCCGWFLDLYVRYDVPNLILRSSLRPSLPVVVAGLSFNLGL
jgi:hypothetical protein